MGGLSILRTVEWLHETSGGFVDFVLQVFGR